ncbi:AraC family transcriptional regulator [Actinomadura darangshiensis]|uniref:AraC family transcriptional regulator n=1 Tax=Actinomadura darangshiensis TaxID=705336 RepID=A0A4V2YVL1_9ACTN|nr:helix-turn-helix transcriptional regulator [Actinomadura darangshiensis]TDD81857.1 AraC family transcriptional regulator [Actinomadura darangshiensis]
MTSLDASPPLSAYQRVVSTDIDVLHDKVEPFAVGHDLQVLEPDVPLDGQVNALGLGAVNLVWVRYGGGGVIVDTPPTEGHFAMCAPIAPMGVEYRVTKRRETAGGNLVLSHDEAMRMTPHPTLGCLVIATSTGRLADHLAVHLGRDYTTPLRFHRIDGPAITPPSIVERTWRYVCDVLDAATAQGGLHPLAARSLEEALLTAILLGLPHTGMECLAEVPEKVPHHLAGAIRGWVETNHHRPIGVTDIAAAVGLGVRQLQVICQEQWGVTPTQLLRGVRLDHARAALTVAQPGPRTVTDIARAAGYLHMSRFAAHYRQRFGETPRQTLKRS